MLPFGYFFVLFSSVEEFFRSFVRAVRKGEKTPPCRYLELRPSWVCGSLSFVALATRHGRGPRASKHASCAARVRGVGIYIAFHHRHTLHRRRCWLVPNLANFSEEARRVCGEDEQREAPVHARAAGTHIFRSIHT